MRSTNLFLDRESGQTIRVEKVDEAFASITVLKQLPSQWHMPVAQYDGTLGPGQPSFVGTYVPLDAGDIRVPDGFRLPANWQDWEKPVIEEAPTERGETPEGVRIGEPEVAPV